MEYVGRIYRPPSEANSMLLQVTVGCSHNRCAYCDMYRDKKFTAKPWLQIESDLREAAEMGPSFEKVFLCDGDALILSTRRLVQILEGIRKHLPWVRRVGTYADTRSVGNKSVDELSELRGAGLEILYHGMESGDDEVLKFVDKGGTVAEVEDMAHKVGAAGMIHSVIILLGIGGTEMSEQHARNTAKTLTRIDPPFVGALTTTVIPGTPLHAMQERGDFSLPGKFRLLEELRTIVADSEFSKCRFSSNHASNYLPIRSELPRDKSAIVSILDEVLERGDERELKPEFLRGL
jgi:radical SAM superfamily enzyme YgiQ (UPF0313 family)